MPRTITVGLDGSPESHAAAEWAANEAEPRGLPVKLVQVWGPVPAPMAGAPLLGAETRQHRTEQILHEAAEALRLRHPGIEVTTEQLTGRPAEVLIAAAEEAHVLVLGSRGLSGVGGFLVGSVGLAVVAHSERPVILVRANAQAPEEQEADPTAIAASAAPLRPVLLGLDTGSPDAALIEFAFAAAARRDVPLRVLHGWNPPYYYAYGTALDPAITETVAQADAAALEETLQPWRHKYADVVVVTESRCGSPSLALIDASREASLVVVGRRIRRSSVGAHIGTVTHAVLHHATAPVAVVAHD
ncbi:universal stress protein [Streptomyces sp. AgN23]|uniref:universal stress protein n=1 Tax=Streptomyces sp. AgN23 TaxID=1188315 RepID=UPI001B34094B|nr:universal stress protein [Streptomyces sp. AgN23]QTI87287.1 universal stress protein [Streptomyces sp. AgN23]